MLRALRDAPINCRRAETGRKEGEEWRRERREGLWLDLYKAPVSCSRDVICSSVLFQGKEKHSLECRVQSTLHSVLCTLYSVLCTLHYEYCVSMGFAPPLPRNIGVLELVPDSDLLLEKRLLLQWAVRREGGTV